MGYECEAKIAVEDFEPLRAALRRMGAVDCGTRRERNYVFDNARKSLGKRGVLLRLRDVGESTALLTVKRPASGGEFKTREEIESRVDGVGNFLRQLDAVGFRVTWIYEKIRQSWRWEACEIALDECPEIGRFVEIEAAPDVIRAAAAGLGLNPDDHIADSYHGLWEKHLRERGEAGRDMVFDSTSAAWADRSRPFSP